MSNIKHGMRIPKSFFITSGYGEDGFIEEE